MAIQSEFIMAINQLAAEKGIPVDDILDAIKQAVRTGYEQKDYKDEEDVSSLRVDIDTDNGNITVFVDKKVVDEVTNPATQISLSQAQKIEKRLKIGDHVQVDVTPQGDFGRIAAQAARQVIFQKIQESERETLLAQFKDKIGGVESAIIQRVDREGNVILEINRATAVMPSDQRIPGEFYRSGSRIKVLLQEIRKDAKGKTLIVSRNAAAFLESLFELEVPELASGTVEVMGIAREAGSRAKFAVKSNSSGIDPIGSCVGQRGVRINAVTNELRIGDHEEKIDIIEWAEDHAKYIANAIKPAEAVKVRIISEENRQALILVNDESLSLAIGKEGQNVRLAAKLTGWNLDIQGVASYEANGSKSMFETDGAPVRESKPAEVTSTNELADLDIDSKTLKLLDAAGIATKSDLTEKLNSAEGIKGVGPKTKEKLLGLLG